MPVMCVEWVSAVLFSGRSAPAGKKGEAVRMVLSGPALPPSCVEWVSFLLFRGKECTCGGGEVVEVALSGMGRATKGQQTVQILSCLTISLWVLMNSTWSG